MKLIKFIEKKAPWVQIKGLPLILSGGYFLFFALVFSGTLSYEKIVLNWNDIQANDEYWRLFTFVFFISASPIWVYFTVYFQWLMGTALENSWGSVKFTLFFYFTFLTTIALSIIFPDTSFIDTFTINVFLVFAFYFPDFIILLFFIIPIKIKWLARLAWVGIIYYLISSKFSLESIATTLTIVLPIFTFTGKEIYYRIKYKTRKTIISSKNQMAAKVNRHQCSICKITDIIDPKKDFRYIEENGKMNCYCESHIPTKKNH